MERKERRKRKKEREKEKKEREKRKLAFRRSELVGPRSKGCIFDEGYAPRGRDSSYFGLFSTLRVVWLCLCPKGLFGRISKYRNAAYFDPTHLLDFRMDFQVGTRGNSDSSRSCKL